MQKSEPCVSSPAFFFPSCNFFAFSLLLFFETWCKNYFCRRYAESFFNLISLWYSPMCTNVPKKYCSLCFVGVVAVTNPTSVSLPIEQIDPENLKSTPERTEIIVGSGNLQVEWQLFTHSFPTFGVSTMQVTVFLLNKPCGTCSSVKEFYGQRSLSEISCVGLF